MAKIIGSYEMKKQIGSGQYGKVHIGQHRKTKETVAIKVISKNHYKKTENLATFIKNESWALEQINHQNVIKRVEAL